MAGGTYAGLRASQGPEHARTFFGAAERLFDALGLTDSASGIRHYRGGGGADVKLGPAEAARHPLIEAAERSNRALFETKTFRGLSPGLPGQRTFLDLKDGEEMALDDYWNRSYNLRPQDGNWLTGLGKVATDAWDLATNPDSYLRFGRFGVESRAKLIGRRAGNTLRVKGSVSHELGPNGDRFDFNSGQIGHPEARALESAGEAQPYRTTYRREEPVEAELIYQPGGGLTLRRSTWNLLR